MVYSFYVCETVKTFVLCSVRVALTEYTMTDVEL